MAGRYLSDGGQQERGTCYVCGEDVPLDGEQAIERWGDVLWRGCSGEPVAFRAECDNQFCDWSFDYEGQEFDRGHVEQIVRNEANTHERTKRIFDDDPMHNTTVEEVTA